MHAVQRASEGRPGTTAAGSTTDVRSKRRAKQRATFCEQGRVEGLIFDGSRLAEDCWTGSAEAATLIGRGTPLAVEKTMFPSVSVLRRTNFIPMMLWVGPISGYFFYYFF